MSENECYPPTTVRYLTQEQQIQVAGDVAMADNHKTHSSEEPIPKNIEAHNHINGIGAELMYKMGYKIGSGLGKKNQGIVEPVQISLLVGRCGLGALKTESIENRVPKKKKMDKKQIKVYEKEDATNYNTAVGIKSNSTKGKITIKKYNKSIRYLNGVRAQSSPNITVRQMKRIASHIKKIKKYKNSNSQTLTNHNEVSLKQPLNEIIEHIFQNLPTSDISEPKIKKVPRCRVKTNCTSAIKYLKKIRKQTPAKVNIMNERITKKCKGILLKTGEKNNSETITNQKLSELTPVCSLSKSKIFRPSLEQYNSEKLCIKHEKTQESEQNGQESKDFFDPKNSLQIAIIDENNADGSIQYNQWQLIQEKLTETLISVDQKEVIFNVDGWNRGVKLINCGNQKTMYFLTEAIRKLDKLWPEVQLKAIPSSMLRIIVTFWLSESVLEEEMFLQEIKKQNPTISTLQWQLISLSKCMIGSGVTVKILMDHKSIEDLKAIACQLKYGSSHLRVSGFSILCHGGADTAAEYNRKKTTNQHENKNNTIVKPKEELSRVDREYLKHDINKNSIYLKRLRDQPFKLNRKQIKNIPKNEVIEASFEKNNRSDSEILHEKPSDNSIMKGSELNLSSANTNSIQQIEEKIIEFFDLKKELVIYRRIKDEIKEAFRILEMYKNSIHYFNKLSKQSLAALTRKQKKTIRKYKNVLDNFKHYPSTSITNQIADDSNVEETLSQSLVSIPSKQNNLKNSFDHKKEYIKYEKIQKELKIAKNRLSNYKNSICYLNRMRKILPSTLTCQQLNDIEKHKEIVANSENYIPLVLINMIKKSQNLITGIEIPRFLTKQNDKNEKESQDIFDPENKLQMAIIHPKNPDSSIEYKQWELIEENILIAMFETNMDEIIFTDDGWLDGVKLINCGNQKTVEFLSQIIRNLDEGVKLKLCPSSMLRNIITMWIDDSPPKEEFFFRYVEKHNPIFDTSNWQLISLLPCQGGEMCVAKIAVDTKSLLSLEGVLDKVESSSLCRKTFGLIH